MTAWEWQNSRLDGGGWTSGVYPDPRGNGVILACTDVAGVFRSVDDGQTWTAQNSGFYTTEHLGVASLAFSPANPDIVVALVGRKGAAAGGGVFVSSDNGQTWGQVAGSPAFSGGNNDSGTGLPGDHPRSTGRLAVVDTARNLLYVATFDDGIRRVQFDPQTGAVSGQWTTVGMAGAYLRCLTFDSTNSRLYAGDYAGGVWRIATPHATATVTEVGGTIVEVEDLLIVEDWLYLASSDLDGQGGIWRAKITGGGADDTAWTNITGPLDVDESRWVTVECEVVSPGTHRLWAACTHSAGDKIGGTGAYINYMLWRCENAASSPSWTCLTHQPDSSVPVTIGGPTGPDWWIAEESAWAIINRPSYFASMLALDTTGRLWISGRSGIWATDNPESATPAFYPHVAGLGNTINRQIAASLFDDGQVLAGNTDHVALWSGDHGTSWEQNKPSPNTAFSVTRDLRTGRWAVGVGDRDDPTVMGRVYTSSDLNGLWTDEKIHPIDDQIDTFDRDITGGTNPWGDVTPATSPATTWTYAQSGSQLKANMGVRSNPGEGYMGIVAGSGLVRANHPTTVETPAVDVEFGWTEQPAGASLLAVVHLRRDSGADNGYLVRCRWQDWGSKPGDLQIFKQSGGVLGSAVASSPTFTLQPGGIYRWRVEAVGSGPVTVRAKIWEANSEPPEDWTITWDDTTSPYTTGTCSLQAQALSGSTATSELAWRNLTIADLTAPVGSDTNENRRVLAVAQSDAAAGGTAALAAVENLGVMRKQGGTWTQLGSGPTMSGQNTKSAWFWWPRHPSGTDSIVYLYDRATGLWRSVDSGATWTLIVATASNTEFTGYIAGPLDDPTVVWLSAAGNLYRVAGADAGSPTVADRTPPGGGVGSIAVGTDGTIYAARPITAAHRAALWAGDGTQTGWENIADAVYEGVAGWPLDMTVSDDGRLYLALFGNGVVVGTRRSQHGEGPPRPLWYPPLPPRTTLAERLRQSHTIRPRFELRTPQGEPIRVLHVVDASVTWDATAPIRGRLTCRITDTDLLGTSGTSALFGNEIAAFYGVVHADGRVDNVPCGVYPIGEGDIDDSGAADVVAVSGMDRARRVQRAAWTAPYQIAAGTNVVDAIRLVLQAADPTLTDFDLLSTAHATTGLVFGVEAGRSDPWSDARQLAETIGCDLWFSRAGRPTLGLVPDTDGVAVAASFTEGETAIITGVSRRLSVDETRNGVIVIADGSGVDVPFQAAAWDTDPDSPTYWHGPFGKAPHVIRTQAVASAGQARDMAVSELLRRLGASEQVTCKAVPDPTLEVNQLVRVRRTAIGVDSTYLVERIGLPFDGGAMQLSMRERRVGIARENLITTGGGL